MSAEPSPFQKCSSVHGPHGPTSPADQKLSFAPRYTMRSSPKPVSFFHSACASSSGAKPASPLNTVIASRSVGRPNTFVRSSHAKTHASSLK